ncbi:MAG: GlsB/YeaQ/YmgE family stress response membrane protein [Bacteroidota bacterium]|nr:GlsB/YeaQ/YmgE family stress response membrane protein [Bacteroidota bacterium]
MSFLWSAIIGLVAGAIAKLIMPGKDPGGIFVTMLIGIVGALLFTFLGKMLGFYQEGESAGFIASILGALVLLGLYRLIKGRGAARGV